MSMVVADLSVTPSAQAADSTIPNSTGRDFLAASLTCGYFLGIVTLPEATLGGIPRPLCSNTPVNVS